MTPAAKPTSTPEITVTPTSTPTTPSRVTNIAFTGVSDSSSKIKINTSTPSKISVAYGTYPTALSQTVTTDRFQTASSVKMTGLTADTDYYFRVITTDRFGHTYASELFTFQTAKQSLTQPI